ncbi:unnamed protein product [Auanema sp. JU1783]|nr:unnamed protein product [Auanema sp. JU1783]
MAGGMHFLVGISTDDYVILAADKASFSYGAILTDTDNDKEFRLGKKMTMICIGEDGDVDHFGEWVKRNIQLYSIRNGYELSPKAAHHWIRGGISKGLRSRESYYVDLLLGGYDDTEKKAFLGSVDYLGNGLPQQPYLFRGFCGRFCYAIMDREYKKGMSEDEGLGLLNKCIAEAKKRFVANIPGYKVLIVDKNGIRHLPDVNF